MLTDGHYLSHFYILCQLAFWRGTTFLLSAYTAKKGVWEVAVGLELGHIFWLLAVVGAVAGLGKLKRKLRLLARSDGAGKIPDKFTKS